MLYSLSRNLSVAADENRFLPFFPFSFLCFHHKVLHDFRRDVLVETPFFQFGFPLALTRNKNVSLTIKGFVESLLSPGCEPVLLFNDVHGAWKRAILRYIEPTDLLLERIPFYIVSI
jgi:hypothetical protein